MTDLNALSPAARSAAMWGGVAGWDRSGCQPDQIRYMDVRKEAS